MEEVATIFAPPEAAATTELEKKTVLSLMLAFLGGAFVINSFIIDLIAGPEKGLGEISGFIGAVLLGAPLVVLAVKDLINGKVFIAELAALAVIASFALGHYKTSGVLAFFLLASQLIERRTALGARASIESLMKLTPTTAQVVLEDGTEIEREVSELSIGETVRVRPGDNIAADGKIVSGTSSVNQANITGESLPVDKTPGDKVFAGTTNITGSLDIEVTSVGEDTTLGKVQDLILEAEASKTPIMSLIDKYAGYYTPFILVVSFLVYFFTRDLTKVITVLVMACPSALILATPTAMVAALATAARRGVLIKNIRDLETAGHLDAFIFDKTGTLTTGKLAVVRVGTIAGMDVEELLKAAASVERYSNHPTAKAVVEIAAEADIELAEVNDFKEDIGKGVSASVDGDVILVGRRTYLEEKGVEFTQLDKDVDEDISGFSMLYIAQDSRAIGWMGLEDRTRPEAREAIQQLRETGAERTIILTGDNESIAKRIAREMACNEYQAQCLPETKLKLVNEMREEGYKVAVVGDGVNDAPALTAGDIGIAMGAAGSDIALNSSSIVLMNNELNRLPLIIRLSRKVKWVVTQNIVLGLLYVAGGVSLAILGLVGPALAALLINIGSLIVIFNSARLVRLGEEIEDAVEAE
jgi:Zn2+/Cd2+-exporting ATPase